MVGSSMVRLDESNLDWVGVGMHTSNPFHSHGPHQIEPRFSAARIDEKSVALYGGLYLLKLNS